MAPVLTFNVAAQVLAAFVIFVSGYIALFVFLVLCFLIAKGAYEGARRVWMFAARPVAAGIPTRPT